jgi:Spx/MgsR family transcriptional regulator
MTYLLYGIRNCDTVRKARAWLDARGTEYEFHDYQRSGVERQLLERWCRELGWEQVLNRAGTSFRKLPDSNKQDLDAAKAIDLMLAQPSMIKRPLLRAGRRWVIGFRPELYAEVFDRR